MGHDKVYDQLPFEVAQVLHWVETWHDNSCRGLVANAESDLSVLADAARVLSEWKERQGTHDRVHLVSPMRDIDVESTMENTRRMMAAVRKQMEGRPRPRLRVVPVVPED